MIKTIFFDVGSVLLNEDWLHFKIYEILWSLLRKHDSRWTFEAIMEEREKRIRRDGDPRPDYSIAREYLPKIDLKTYTYYVHYFSVRRRYAYLREIPGIRYVVHNLAPYYQLGIIANQPAFITDYLRRKGLLYYFKIIAISEAVNMRKPDREIFEWALKQARTQPEAAIMIGDRIDHDVLPSKQLGMHTILAAFTRKAKGILPQSYRERLYFEALERTPNWPQKPASRQEIPDAVVHKPEELIPAIQALDTPDSGKETTPGPTFWETIKTILKEMAEVEVESD